MAQIEQMMGTAAVPPARVAAAVAHVVRADRFWIITHQVSKDRVRRRNADVEAERNPR